MGLIKAVTGAAGGVLADTWKEFYSCDSMGKDTLVIRGVKQTTRRSSNKKGNDNIITNGSGIAVADGQCMIIVDNGKIVEICAEPGEYTYDSSSEPSLFYGNLGESVKKSFERLGRRIGFGGDPGHDQRIYYFNVKELLDNKFGTPNPIPFRVVDKNINLDVDVSLRCSGIYSYKITDPVLFYTNVCGNITSEYKRSEIQDQLKAEFISALQPSLAQLSAREIRPNQIVAHTEEIAKLMDDTLSEEWRDLRGLDIITVSFSSVTLPEEDQEMIKRTQRAGALRDPGMAAATLTEAQAEALKNASENESGAMNGFIGMGMAMNAGGMNAGELFNMAQKNGQKSNVSGVWRCSCGTENTGNYCTVCGTKKPEGSYCAKCGNPVKPGDKFCSNCGAGISKDGEQ